MDLWMKVQPNPGKTNFNLNEAIKHLVTQPGNAPKTVPFTVDVAFKGLSEDLAFKDGKCRVLRRMQTLIERH